MRILAVSATVLVAFLLFQNFSFHLGPPPSPTAGDFEFHFADIDGDGKKDLLTRSVTSGLVLVYPSGPSGLSGRSFALGNFPFANKEITFADVNGDLREDLVSHDNTTGVIVAYPSTGTALGAGLNYGQLPFYTFQSYFADFNGDRLADLLAQNRTTGEVLLFPGSGRGLTGASYSLGRYPTYEVKFGDVTGDGRSDLVLRNRANGAVYAYTSTGTGLGAALAFGSYAFYEYALVLADINADNRADLVFKSYTSGAHGARISTGAGLANSVINFGTLPLANYKTFAADVTGDRRADLIALDYASGRLLVWPFNGSNLTAAIQFGMVPSWNLAFADEFSGTSLNLSNWDTKFKWGARSLALNPAVGPELQCYMDDAVSVSGGTLRLRASNTPSTCENGNLAFRSGMVSSHKTQFYTYGYYEIRARFPASSGFWPAFWMLPKGPEQKTEIDIMEGRGVQNRYVHMNLHAPSGMQPTSFLFPSTDTFGTYHVYAIDWQPGQIIWYIDGVERKRIQGATVPAVPMYVIANLAVGAWGGPVAAGSIPAVAEIDYIRIYRTPHMR